MQKRAGITGLFGCALAIVAVSGCSSPDPGAADAGRDASSGTDTGMVTADTGGGTDTGTDAGSVVADAGSDTGTTTADAGSDAGTTTADTGTDAATTGTDFCDVVYAIGSGTCATPTRTARFHTIKTGLGASNMYADVGTNCTTPHRGDGTTAVDSPFTPTAFPRGYVRLRFPAAAGAPTAGAVQLVEYYLPIEFLVNTAGTMVTTDVDHSAGLLSYASTGCGTGVSGCLTGVSDTTGPTLARACTSVASGTLAGTTLTWDACPVTPPAAYTMTTGTPSMAQQRWSPGMSQDSASSAGCLTNESSWGGVACMGTFCGAVPGLTAPTNATWDQHLPNMTFSSASYGATGTTLTLGEMIIPDEPTDVYTGSVITTATVVHVECGALATLTCDDQ